MTTTPRQPDFNDLPPELAGLARDLDRLAAAEADSAGPSLEDRVLLRTRSAATHEGMTPEVRRVHEGLTAIALREAASAPANLEDRVFNATVDALRGRPAVAGVITRAPRWTARLAIAAGLALAAVAGYVALSGPHTTKDSGTLANNDATNPVIETPKETLALSGDLEQILTTTEAEANFAALFAMNVDTLGSEIRTASLEAERLDNALLSEAATDPTTNGG